MADIAQIGFSADTSDLHQAKVSLDALVPAAEKVDRANSNLSSSFERVNQSAGIAKGGIDRLANGIGMQSELVNRAATANFSMAGGFDILTGKSNSTFAAINKNMQAMGLFEKSAHGAGNAIKFTANEGLNFSRQMADIGVTLAMGMNPLMVALQQGPQLFDILQTAGMRSGVGIGAVFRAAGQVIWGALAPILPIILAIGSAVGIVAAGLSLFARSLDKDFGDVTIGMGLTEKQMEKVKKAGIETGVTLSDVFFGFFDVVGDRLQKAFDGPLKWLRNIWGETLDFITEYGYKAIKFVIGVFVGAVYAIIASWKLLPGAIGAIIAGAANLVISGIEWMINKAIAGLNILLDFANSIAEKLGFDGLGHIGEVSLGRVQAFAGKGQAFGQAFAKGFGEGMKDTGSAVDGFVNDWGKASRKRAQDRVREAAGDPEKGPKTKDKSDRQHHEKTNGEKFEDLMKDADRQIAQLKRQNEEIGLYGQALARAKFEHQLMNEAAEKGIALGPQEIAMIKAKSEELAKQSELNRHGEFFQGLIEKADQENFMFERQRGELRLTGEALIAYQHETEMLAQAKSQHINLTDQEIAAIHESSVAYAANAEEIRKQREALEFSKETTKSFFMDFYQNVRQGQTIWDAFANAFVSAIDKIIEKFKTDSGGQNQMGGFLNLIGGLFGFKNGGVFGSSGCFGFANGGLFGSDITPFAKGGTFTNSVVNTPTLFKFANGGALGLMGEAGPEAILPLKRGSNGALGVQMHGGGSGQGGKPSINVEITNHHVLTGAVSSEDVIKLNKLSAEKTKQELRQQIPGILEQYQRDGSLV
jgi:hypothetical protein